MCVRVCVCVCVQTCINYFVCVLFTMFMNARTHARTHTDLYMYCIISKYTPHDFIISREAYNPVPPGNPRCYLLTKSTVLNIM